MGHVAHAVHNGSVHAPQIHWVGVWHDMSILVEEMTAKTYDLITESNGTPALKCLLCRGESSSADDVQRLYCSHCA